MPHRKEEQDARRRHVRQPALESMEPRRLMAALTIASAKVLPDGRTLQLAFTEPLPASRGVPNGMAGYDAGVRLTTNTGVALENIGSWVTADATKLTWTTNYLATNATQVVRFGQTGLTISAGAGLLRDDADNWTSAVSNYPVVNNSLVDASGFTTQAFARGAGGATIYVSSTYGDDKRSFAQAQNPATPYKTVAAALAQAFANGQTGKGADVRLLRGDTFTAGGAIKTSGQDPAHPFVIEDYWYQYKAGAVDPGTRPRIAIDEAAATTDSVFDTTNGGGTPATVDHVVIRRLQLEATNWTGNVTSQQGLTFLRGGRNLTIDDCAITNFGSNISIQGYWGAFQDVTINRCIVADARYDNAVVKDHSQGLFLQNAQGILITQCTFDDNGRVSADRKGRDMFSHNIYIKEDCGPAVVWGNYIRSGGSYGIEMRSGGVLAYNYFGRNALASFIDGIGGTQYKNVVEYGEDISAALPRGIGLGVTTDYGSAVAETVAYNIVLNSKGSQKEAIKVEQTKTNKVENLLITHNTVVDAGPIKLASTVTTPGYRSADLNRNVVDSRAGTLLEVPAYSKWSFYKADENVYNSTLPANAVDEVGDVPTSQAGFAKLNGGDDAKSINRAPAYANGAADIASFNASLGGNRSEAEFVSTLRNRAPGRWSGAQNTLAMYDYYAKSYQAGNLPAVGNGSSAGYGAGKSGIAGSGMIAAAAPAPNLASSIDVPMSTVTSIPMTTGTASTASTAKKSTSTSLFDADGRLRLSS